MVFLFVFFLELCYYLYFFVLFQLPRPAELQLPARIPPVSPLRALQGGDGLPQAKDRHLPRGPDRRGDRDHQGHGHPQGELPDLTFQNFKVPQCID